MKTRWFKSRSVFSTSTTTYRKLMVPCVCNSWSTQILHQNNILKELFTVGRASFSKSVINSGLRAAHSRCFISHSYCVNNPVSHSYCVNNPVSHSYCVNNPVSHSYCVNNPGLRPCNTKSSVSINAWPKTIETVPPFSVSVCDLWIRSSPPLNSVRSISSVLHGVSITSPVKHHSLNSSIYQGIQVRGIHSLSVPKENLDCGPCGMADEVTPPPQKQFYRRELPEGCIEFSSKEGKLLFQESLLAGHMDCYFRLAAQFRTQDEPAFCGLSTLVMVLNALSVDPGRVWKGPWRWYHESMLDCCTSLPLVKQKGITFDQFVCLAECNFLNAKSVPSTDPCDYAEFREVVKSCTSQDETVLVTSYSRKSLNQTGDGHFSPVGGYHPGRDLVLVLDTARFKYPPHWVPLTTLVTAMKQIDQETGKPRGYVLLSKDLQFKPLLLFRLASQLSVTLPQGVAPECMSFLNQWLDWLRQEAVVDQSEGTLVTEAITNLIKMAASLSDDACLLTSQVDVKCPELVSPGHLCAAQRMIRSVEEQQIFELSSKTLKEYLLSESKEMLHRLCKAAGQTVCGTGKVQCCELQRLLTPSHFFTMLLLSWPYRTTTSAHKSNADVLQNIVNKSLENVLLQNEVNALQQQLKTILTLYNRDKQLCCCKVKSKVNPLPMD